MLKDYCEFENVPDCRKLHDTGCGLTSKCPHDERCVNDPSTEEGYKCIKGIIYGKILPKVRWSTERE